MIFWFQEPLKVVGKFARDWLHILSEILIFAGFISVKQKIKSNYLEIFWICFDILKSSHRKCSVKYGLLKNFAKFTGKHLCWSLFAGLKGWNFIKKRIQHKCFSVKIAKSLRTPIFKNICEQLLLYSLPE